MDHKLHIKLYIRTAKGYPGELNVFGDSGKELAQAIAGVFEAMNLDQSETSIATPIVVAPMISATDPGREALIAEKAEEFLATCDLHHTRWYNNPSKSGGTYKSHKIEQNVFCRYSQVADSAWKVLMAQLNWGEVEAKGWLDEYLGGGPFNSLSELGKAQAIARLRVGR